MQGPRVPGKNFVAKFTRNHNSQLFMLHGRLVYVGETSDLQILGCELHKNPTGPAGDL